MIRHHGLKEMWLIGTWMDIDCIVGTPDTVIKFSTPTLVVGTRIHVIGGKHLQRNNTTALTDIRMQGNPEGIDQWLIRVGKWLHFRIALSVAVIARTLCLQPIQKTNRKVTASV